ncbi:MAG: aminoglycoside 6-adenylyltransferase, partial [Chloroflexales bacterium]|nr:aminoglycoside 6-adenylyltransferase [Chloroflexales bacterium]
EDAAAFADSWQVWAAQFGTLRLGYTGGVGHPWAGYDAAPVPLRVDLNVWRASDAPEMLAWPNAPTSVEAMVLYDATDGQIAAQAARLVGRSLAPVNMRQTFDAVCGDFWYYALRTYARLQRRQLWAARYDFNAIIVGNLLALLRLEAGAVERWQAASAGAGIEQAIAPARLERLNECVAAPGEASLLSAFRSALALGRDVCAAIAARHGWPWPSELAERVERLFAEYAGSTPSPP